MCLRWSDDGDGDCGVVVVVVVVDDDDDDDDNDDEVVVVVVIMMMMIMMMMRSVGSSSIGSGCSVSLPTKTKSLTADRQTALAYTSP